MPYIKRYTDQKVQKAYENACDSLYFGMGPHSWNDCGIPPNKREEVWAVAWYDMGDGYEEKGKKSVQEVFDKVFPEKFRKKT